MKNLIVLAGLLTGFTYEAFTQNIVQAEYFFDRDNGAGKNIPINLAAAADGTFPLSVSVNGISAGYHKLYIRAKDSDGRWGQTTRRNIEVVPTLGEETVIAGEYFIDSDLGFGAGTAIQVSSPATDISQTLLASTENLSIGYHKLYSRFKNSDGKWGLTARRNIEVAKNLPNSIVKAEWFVDKDPGVGLATPLHLIITDTSAHSYLLPFPCINADSAYFLYIRVQDALGNWSLTAWPQNKFTLKNANTITTLKSGLWGDASVWSNNKVPDANSYIILNHEITVNVPASCKYLLTLCHPVKINAGIALAITGNL